METTTENTITLGRVYNAYQAVLRLSKLLFPPAKAKELYRLRLAMEQHVNFLGEEEMKIALACGGTAEGETGRITFNRETNPDGFTDYQAKDRELQLMPVDLGAEPITLPASAIEGITADEIAALDGIINIE